MNPYLWELFFNHSYSADLSNEVSLFDRIKKDGTITLDELMEELSKGGLKNIHFNEMSFNLEKFTLDNVEKTGFEENVDKILEVIKKY